MGTSVEVIYQLNDISAEEGIDVFKIAPILMHFGELIRSANSVLGYEQKIDIRIKPFKEGSWITQFILENKYIASILGYFKSRDGVDLLLLLALLGLDVKGSIEGVVNIIRFTKGKVSSFRKNKNGNSFTYINEKDEKLTVSPAEHKLVQSPLIQKNYYNCVIEPLVRFPSATAVTIRAIGEGESEQTFTQADRPAFEAYAKTILLGDVEDNISLSKGVFLKPKRGSYSGMEKAYSFIMGNITLYPVSIEDEQFLGALRSGDIRLFSEDALKVDLEIRQKKDASNKVQNNYAIIKVIKYSQYKKPNQLRIEDVLKSENNDEP